MNTEFALEDLMKMSKRKLADTVQASIAQVEILLTENAQLELKLAQYRTLHGYLDE